MLLHIALYHFLNGTYLLFNILLDSIHKKSRVVFFEVQLNKYSLLSIRHNWC